jgi:alpha-beta hydrolase superfamily lysophospholipase
MPWLFAPATFQAKDGLRIAYQVVHATGPAKAAVVLVHGHGEYAYRYRHVVEAWQDVGITTLVIDRRGHNASEGARGHVRHFDLFVDDLLGALAAAASDTAWRELSPPILFGHSYGGLIAIHTALKAPDRFGGLVLSSPFVGMALDVPIIKRATGVMLSRVWPTLALATGIRGEHVSRDPAVAAAFDQDPRMVAVATTRLYTETRKAQQAALRAAPQLRLPLYCVQAGDDVVASPEVSRRFFEAAGSTDKRFELAVQGRHETLNDLDRAAWTSKLGDVILGMARNASALAS